MTVKSQKKMSGKSSDLLDLKMPKFCILYDSHPQQNTKTKAVPKVLKPIQTVHFIQND